MVIGVMERWPLKKGENKNECNDCPLRGRELEGVSEGVSGVC